MEPNIKLCCFTVKPGGCHQEKSCPEFLSSESRSDVFGAGAQVWSRRVSDESFLAKLAYLSDIFGNEVNLQLQGKDKNLPQVTRSALSLKACSVGQETRWRRHRFIGEPAWICWHYWRWCRLSDSIYQAAYFITDGILLKGLPWKQFPAWPAPTGFSFAEQNQFIDVWLHTETAVHITDTEWILAECREAVSTLRAAGSGRSSSFSLIFVRLLCCCCRPSPGPS